jgi:hypothetical protein
MSRKDVIRIIVSTFIVVACTGSDNLDDVLAALKCGMSEAAVRHVVENARGGLFLMTGQPPFTERTLPHAAKLGCGCFLAKPASFSGSALESKWVGLG